MRVRARLLEAENVVTAGKRWVRRARSAQGRRLSSSFREVMPLKAWRQRSRSSPDREVSRSRIPLRGY